MVTFKVLQLCNEGIFLLNGASAGFSLERGWHWLERVQERRRKKRGRDNGRVGGIWLRAKQWKVYRHFKVMLHPIHL